MSVLCLAAAQLGISVSDSLLRVLPEVAAFQAPWMHKKDVNCYQQPRKH